MVLSFGGYYQVATNEYQANQHINTSTLSTSTTTALHLIVHRLCHLPLSIENGIYYGQAKRNLKIRFKFATSQRSVGLRICIVE